jgi:hypothetical protein
LVDDSFHGLSGRQQRQRLESRHCCLIRQAC